MRLFTAVELPPPLRTTLARSAGEVLSGMRGVRRVAEENLHVTVRFLGEVPEAEVDRLVEVLGQAGATVPSGVAVLAGFGAFPRPQRPRVLWAGVEDPAGSLTALAAQVSQALPPLGVPQDPRPYVPHVTVARMQAPPRRREAGRIVAACAPLPVHGSFAVRELTLFSSILRPSGAVHEALVRLSLSG